MRRWRSTALGVMLVLAGCEVGRPDPRADDPSKPADTATPATESGVDGGAGGGPGGGLDEETGDMSGGATLYASLCVHCHGAGGRGASAPALRGYSAGRENLVSTIDASMPVGNAGACVGACAESIADWLLTLPVAETPSCDPPPLLPRRLRLLTRGELNRTVKDLLRPVQPRCTSVGDCDILSESCIEGFCRPDACGVETFVYDPADTTPSSVSLAGDFNAWNPRDPASALSYHVAAGRWLLKRSLPDGSHAYKFVLDGTTWVADPGASTSVSDGHGASNSVRTVRCQGVPAPVSLDDEDWSAGLPLETRPTHFAFDNHEGALVTATHVDELLAMTAKLARVVAPRIERLTGCAPVGDGSACAESFVRNFGQRAWRRMLADDEVARLSLLVTAAPTFSEGVLVAMRVLLSAPAFLYRSEVGTLDAARSTVAELDNYEIATALSYLLLGSMPDDALLAAAAAGTLSDPTVREQHARRLLAEPRAREVTGRFALMWLGAERVLTVDKNVTYDSVFTGEVRSSMAQETQRFFNHVMFDSTGRFDELLTAEEAVVDDVLAAFYGLTTATSGFTIVPTQNGRAGILGQGSVLASYAYSAETAPVRRGLFVRERLLCQELGTPPPNAGAIPEMDPNATTRERFAQHTEDAFCYACHQYIDPVGFGFESFDAIGRYRTTDHGLPVDSTGDMNDVEGLGTATSAPFDNLATLGGVLAASDAAQSCFVRQVQRFVTGRLAGETEELCASASSLAAFRSSGGDIQELLISLVTDEAFVRRQP